MPSCVGVRPFTNFSIALAEIVSCAAVNTASPTAAGELGTGVVPSVVSKRVLAVLQISIAASSASLSPTLSQSTSRWSRAAAAAVTEELAFKALEPDPWEALPLPEALATGLEAWFSASGCVWAAEESCALVAAVAALARAARVAGLEVESEEKSKLGCCKDAKRERQFCWALLAPSSSEFEL